MKLRSLQAAAALTAAVTTALTPIAALAQSTYEFKRAVPGLKSSAALPGSGGSSTPQTPAGTPALSLSTQAVDFGNVATNTTEKRQVVVSNTGDGTLSITRAATVSGAAEFAAGLTTCGSTLAAGADCLLEPTFSPTTAGTFNGVLTFTTTLAGSPHDITLVGTAFNPVSLSSATLPSAIVGQAYSYDFKPLLHVSNEGSPAIEAASWGVSSGSLPAGLTLNPSNGVMSGTPSAPSSGEGQTFTISGTYQGNQGQRAYTLVVTGTSTLAQTSGSGAFGATALNTTKSATFVFQATGTNTLTGVQLSKSGSAEFTLGANSCGTAATPVQLAAGATCSVTVSYAPTAAGAHSGSLVLASSATNGPLTLNLTGEGATPTMFNYTGSIATYIAPTTGAYSFEVAGAQGGAQSNASGGGRGARVTCTVTLTAGDSLKILVGQRGGGLNTGKTYAGGGGGSFVTRADNTPLCIAGGGAGGTTTALGGRGFEGTGQGGTANGHVAGGGGLLSNGQNSISATGGKSFVSGGAAVISGDARMGVGGFGGGAAADTGQGNAGAGGGYSGGSGLTGGIAQGGSSYSATPDATVVLGQHTGNGYVSIVTP